MATNKSVWDPTKHRVGPQCLHDFMTFNLEQRLDLQQCAYTKEALRTLVPKTVRAAMTMCKGTNVTDKDGNMRYLYGPELHDHAAQFVLITTTRRLTMSGLVLEWPDVSKPHPDIMGNNAEWWSLIDTAINIKNSLDDVMLLLAGRMYAEKAKALDIIEGVKKAQMTPAMVCLCFLDDDGATTCGLVSIVPLPPSIEHQIRYVQGTAQ